MTEEENIVLQCGFNNGTYDEILKLWSLSQRQTDIILAGQKLFIIY